MTTANTITITTTDEFARQHSLKYAMSLQDWAQRIFDMAVPGVQADALNITMAAYQANSTALPAGGLDVWIEDGLDSGLLQTASAMVANNYVLIGTTWTKIQGAPVVVANGVTVDGVFYPTGYNGNAATSNATANSTGG